MAIELRLPSITAKNDSEKIAQLTKYIYQLTEQLNFSLNTIETSVSSDAIKQYTSGSSSKTEEEALEEQYATVKSMIIKSADFIQSIETELSTSLSGSYVASSTFGAFQQSTNATLTANSSGITQLYGYTSNIRSDYGDFDVANESYIKTGLLYYNNSQPVYGVGVGLLSATTDANGHRVLDKSNLATTFSSGEIAFWGNNTKLASITPSHVYFPSGTLTAYNATISGYIAATSGVIGGCSIVDGTLQVPVANITGTLTANSINVPNKLNASVSSGTVTIGGWNVTQGRISKDITYSSTTYTAMMNAPDSFGSNTPGDYVAFGVKRGSEFVSRIDYNGDFHSKSGDIGGWSISPTQLSRSYTVGGTTYSAIINAPSSLSSVSGYVAFGVHAGGSFKAYVDYAGHLYANDAYIAGEVHALSGSFKGTVTTGNLTATGGEIGGWAIGSNNIHSTSGNYGTYNGTTTSGNYIASETGYMFLWLFSDYKGIVYRLYASNSLNSTLLAEFKSYSNVTSSGGGETGGETNV